MTPQPLLPNPALISLPTSIPTRLPPFPFPIPMPTPIGAPIGAAYRPNPSVRPVELTTAIALVILAMALRWLPSREGAAVTVRQAASASAAWPSTSRRPPLRQVLGAVFTGCAVGLFIGGSGGLFCGPLSTIGVLIFGSRRVSDSEKRDRLRLIAAAPPVVDLFAAGLAAGLLPADAAAATATAFRPPDQTSPPIPPDPASPPIAPDPASPTIPPDAASPAISPLDRFRPRRFKPRITSPPIDPTVEIARRFADAAQALRQGAEPETAWCPLAVDGATASVAAAAVRASRTGAPAAETVAKAARDLWNAAEQAAQSQLRSAAVRATVPLALCFLPAFILLGVIPTMIGILAELRT